MFNGNTFAGGKVCVYDRTRMLSGLAPSQQCFDVGTSFGGLLPTRAGSCRALRVRCDATIAPFDDRDSEGHQFFGADVERAGGQRGLVELTEAPVHVGNRSPQIAVQHTQLVENNFAHSMLSHSVTLLPRSSCS